MSESNKHINLFTDAGCLTTEALKGYSNDTLSENEKHQVQCHLETCELCSDAFEGLQLMNDPGKLNSIVAEINENLKNTLPDADKTQSAKFRSLTNLYYFAAAASILILVGLFSYFKFYTQDPHSEIATLDETTVYEQSEPIHKSDEHSKAEIIVKDDITDSKPETSTKTGEIENQVKSPDILPAEVMESEMEIVIDDTDPVDNEKVILEETIEEVVMAEPASISEEDLNEIIVSEYAVSSKGMAADQMSISDDQAAPEIQTASQSPSTAKKGRQKSSVETMNNYMIEPDSLSESTATIFTVVEETPEFPGGDDAMNKYFQENLVYPDSARILGIQGVVYTTFVVEKSGKIESIKILRGIGGGCDEMAIKLIEFMPDWVPGKQRGKPVNVQINLPIEFKLDQ